jgi:hypothetical protein
MGTLRSRVVSLEQARPERADERLDLSLAWLAHAIGDAPELSLAELADAEQRAAALLAHIYGDENAAA